MVLIDNAGGGIFQQLTLPVTPAKRFERLFAMPQAVNPLALAAAHGIPTRQISCLEDLDAALAWGLALSDNGPVLLRVCSDAGHDASLRQRPDQRPECTERLTRMAPQPPVLPGPITADWQPWGSYSDILVARCDGIARVAINRPAKRNAFRPQTVAELCDAFTRIRDDREIGVVLFTGVGPAEDGGYAFCSGGDQSVRGDGGYVGEDGLPRLNVLDLQRIIRTLPKVVIALVAGYAMGGGQVLHLLCDLSLAADNAVFGQTGPKVGSLDGGYGSGFLARVVGQRKAREIWFLCRRYGAEQALEMGLVNAVVPLEQLEAEGVRWAREVLQHSPTAIRCLKAAFNAETDGQAGIQELAATPPTSSIERRRPSRVAMPFSRNATPISRKSAGCPDPRHHGLVAARRRAAPASAGVAAPDACRNDGFGVAGHGVCSDGPAQSQRPSHRAVARPAPVAPAGERHPAQGFSRGRRHAGLGDSDWNIQGSRENSQSDLGPSGDRTAGGGAGR